MFRVLICRLHLTVCYYHVPQPAPVLSKEFPDIQATIECNSTGETVLDTIITYGQMHQADKYSQHGSIIKKTRTSTSLAKWLSVRLQTSWLRVQVRLLSLKLQILRLF